jgi:hypothetical protein
MIIKYAIDLSTLSIQSRVRYVADFEVAFPYLFALYFYGSPSN